MSQQIINIPINWDDDVFSNIIERGVIYEVKNKIEKEARERLGLQRTYGYNQIFEDIIRECMRELINNNREQIIEEVIGRAHKSLINSKDYKEAKAKLKGEIND